MDREIHWESDLETGLRRSREEDKPILLEFFSPG